MNKTFTCLVLAVTLSLIGLNQAIAENKTINIKDLTVDSRCRKSHDYITDASGQPFTGTMKTANERIGEYTETEVLKGFYHGKQKTFFKDGQLKRITTYKLGYINGEAKIYYPSGKLRAEISIVKDHSQGPFKEYYENGNLKLEGFNNYMTGPSEIKQYDEDGRLKNRAEK